MTVASKQSSITSAVWEPAQVYVMAGVCLLVGIVVGYLVRSSSPPVPNPDAQQVASTVGMQPAMPSLEDMKRMADKQVQPLLEKLKTDPKNADLLNQIGNIYRYTHQFDTAVSYYRKSLDSNPKNVGPRTDLASCLYYQGDVDGAIKQLEKSVSYDPKHAGTLFNLGLIRWKGKRDSAGAIAAWQKLLQLHPDYENKEQVQNLIAEARNKGTQAPLK